MPRNRGRLDGRTARHRDKFSANQWCEALPFRQQCCPRAATHVLAPAATDGSNIRKPEIRYLLTGEENGTADRCLTELIQLGLIEANRVTKEFTSYEKVVNIAGNNDGSTRAIAYFPMTVFAGLHGEVKFCDDLELESASKESYLFAAATLFENRPVLTSLVNRLHHAFAVLRSNLALTRFLVATLFSNQQYIESLWPAKA